MRADHTAGALAATHPHNTSPPLSMRSAAQRRAPGEHRAGTQHCMRHANLFPSTRDCHFAFRHRRQQRSCHPRGPRGAQDLASGIGRPLIPVPALDPRRRPRPKGRVTRTRALPRRPIAR